VGQHPDAGDCGDGGHPHRRLRAHRSYSAVFEVATVFYAAAALVGLGILIAARRTIPQQDPMLAPAASRG